MITPDASSFVLLGTWALALYFCSTSGRGVRFHAELIEGT